MKRLPVSVILVGGAIALLATISGGGDVQVSYEAPDEFTLVGDRHLVRGLPAIRANGLVRVVVEIPTGTTAKWEVDKSDGALRWELVEGEPRVVRYLGYPGNYGMVPRTLLPKEEGGDGDPLDVIVLGPAVSRGTIVSARLIGVLKLLDGGEQDDKLIAVQHGTPLGDVRSIAELDEEFPGVTTIVETWFESYKGPGKMESLGFGGVDVAREVLDTACIAFETADAAR